MEQRSRTALVAHFSALEDPRQQAKVLYPLPEIVLLLLCATLAGADDFVEMGLWGKQNLVFLRRFLAYEHGVPSHDTLGEVIRVVDPDLFRACFTSWVEGLREDAPDIVAIDGTSMSPARVLAHLNEVGGANGVGRTDIVENRYVGMKSRGAYETPGGTILLKAHRAIESITLDRGVAHLKDELMPRYAEMIYNGFWFSPEREMLQAAIDSSQYWVNGRVRLRLYKGNVEVVGRKSEDTLFDEAIATFEEDDGAYDQADAEGFIKLNALRLRTLARRAARAAEREAT